VTLRYPHINPVMQLAKNAETRKKMWIANCHKAHPANLTVLPEIVGMRSQIAQLLLQRNNASDSDLAFAKVSGWEKEKKKG
jgi:Zn-dependent oligopeptidase